jgi:hypothetical protein
MPIGQKPTRRWYLFVSFVLALGGFVLSTSPDDAVSNFSKWMNIVWPDMALPPWVRSPSFDTIGKWVTSVMAVLSFAWFLEQYIPAFDWIRRRFSASVPPPMLNGSSTGIDASVDGRKRKVFRRLVTRMRLVFRRTWRVVQQYLPWDYELPREIFAVNAVQIADLKDDRIAFSSRFSDAFPGSGNITTFNQPRRIIQRLNVLLRWPVVGKQSSTQFTPFYWTDGRGNMHVTRYYQYKRNIVLLNQREISPSFLAAIRGGSYFQTFVYLEGREMPAKQIPREELSNDQKYQEFAVYKDKIVSRGEFDDGSYLVRGRPREFTHRPDRRSRYLEKRGLLLLANSSVANRLEHDETINRLINNVIRDKKNISYLADFLLSLPKN